ncbi:hypothetical protein ABFT38_002493 [Salmonella enterica]|nr:hypothetical protein [Salmonella enterica]EHJ9402012.1 hypothetical protein [Salmonella enterica]
MNPEQAKLKQREDARRRSRQAPRRASSQAVSSDQSEITEEAPAVYRVPQINVPEDIQGVAKLIQTELAKIEQSQTILLSIWQKVKDQANDHDDIEFKKTIRVNSTADQKIVRIRPDNTHWSYDEWRNNNDYSRDAYMGVAPNSSEFQIQAETGGVGIKSSTGTVNMATAGGSWALNPDGEVFAILPAHYYNTGEFNLSLTTWAMDGLWPVMSAPGWSIRGDAGGGEQWSDNADTAPLDMTIFCYPCNNTPPNNGAGVLHTFSSLNGAYMGQLFFNYAGNTVSYRTRNGDSATWNSWMIFQTAVEAKKMRKELKAEIYAELLELNPGIVIPKTD